MRQIFIDGIVFGIQRGGGVSLYFSELVKYLLRSGTNFDLVAPVNDNMFFKQLPKTERVVSVPTRWPMLVERARSVKGVSGYPVFHSTYYRRPAAGFDGRQVVTVHDFTAERIYGNTLRGRVFAEQKRRAMMAADHIIAISAFTHSEILNLYPELGDKTISVIPNGIGRAFKNAPSFEGGHSQELAFIGSRAPYKNFIPVVEALADHTDISLVVVGGGPLSTAEKGALDSCIGGRYRCLDFVTDQELAGMLAGSLALIYPSDMEGFGIPPIEAMSVGCPAIVQDIPATREVCGDAAVFLSSVNKEEIGAALETLRCKSKRHEIIKAGYERASLYDWDKTCSAICDVYRSLV